MSRTATTNCNAGRIHRDSFPIPLAWSKYVHRVRSGILYLFLLAGVVPGICQADPPSCPGDLLEVAELNDIFFIDPDSGWAVGDHGVIWQTTNGGRDWKLVDSPATCRLEAVHFVDENHGWIVGGWIHPFTYKSSAVVLYTDNGGHRWTRIDQPLVPALKWVHFVNRRQGWAVGNVSSIYATGVMRTEDGGRSWSSYPISDPRTFVTAAMTGRQQLIALDRDSLPWFLAGADLQPASRPDPGLRSIKAVSADGANAWLAGDGGLILNSSDGGGSWTVPAGAVPTGLARHFDWQAVATRGKHCWIAGAPGTCVLKTADNGGTWQAHPTQHRLPLRALCFLDEHQGWAAGSFGCILATRDGGRTWRAQRKGAERSGLVGVFSALDSIPWEVLANVAADEGHCAVVQMAVSNRDVEPGESTASERARSASAAVGAACDLTSWRFPTTNSLAATPADVIVRRWDAESARTPLERYEEYLVHQIRMWRPDVMVCDSISPNSSRPLPHLISQLVMQACERAADPAAYSDQITTGQLQPWPVKKIFSVLPAGQRGAVTVDHEKLAVRLGCSLSDFATVSRSLASNQFNVPATTTELRIIGGRAIQESGRRDLFSGITPGAVGESRRESLPSVGVNLDSLARVLEKRRETQQFIAQAAGQGNAASAILPQLDRLVAGFSPHYAGVILHRMAAECRSMHQFDGAAQIQAALVQRYPNHLFADAALLELIDYHSSRENRIAFHSDDSLPAETVAVRLPPADATETRANAPSALPLRPAAYTQTADPLPLDYRQMMPAVRMFEQMKAQKPVLYHDPATQLRLASLHRRAGNGSESARILNVMSNAAVPMHVRNCARAEQWLETRSGRAPRPVVVCQAGIERPYLDGVLDEALWQQVEPAILNQANSESGEIAEVRFACDEQYLYLGIHCMKSRHADYTILAAERTRDAQLSPSDRIEIMLDIDRDYATAFKLAIDHRGWTNDACCEQAAWDPRWHVASNSTETEWSVEAALPFTEVDSPIDGPRQAWGLAIQRHVAGGAVHCWAHSGIPTSPLQTYGYLLFH